MERLGKKGKRGTKTSKGRREKGRETTAAPGTAIFTLRHSWSQRWVAAAADATCIRLHKSEDRFSISLTNKRGSDRPRRSNDATHALFCIDNA